MMRSGSRGCAALGAGRIGGKALERIATLKACTGCRFAEAGEAVQWPLAEACECAQPKARDE